MNKRTKKQLKNLKKTTNNLVKQATWLPVFPGFYNTFFDESEHFLDYELNLTDDELKEYYAEVFEAGVSIEYFRDNFSWYCNFEDCFTEASKNICFAILEAAHAGIIHDIEYEDMISPRYYNFSNDSINCEITYNQKKLKKYLQNNFEAFKKYIEDGYTSCSGFISSYSNDTEVWLDETNWHDHEVGSLLNFVIFNEDKEATINLYYDSNLSECFFGQVIFDSKKMIEEFFESQKKEA